MSLIMMSLIIVRLTGVLTGVAYIEAGPVSMKQPSMGIIPRQITIA
jgi:hypothetical protein